MNMPDESTILNKVTHSVRANQLIHQFVWRDDSFSGSGSHECCTGILGIRRHPYL